MATRWKLYKALSKKEIERYRSAVHLGGRSLKGRIREMPVNSRFEVTGYKKGSVSALVSQLRRAFPERHYLVRAEARRRFVIRLEDQE